METVSNLASAASKAIWGEPEKSAEGDVHQEPVSGETGDTSAGEPYDKGNEEPTSTTTTTTEPTSNASTLADTTAGTKSELGGSNTTELPIRSASDTADEKSAVIEKPVESTDTGLTAPSSTVKDTQAAVLPTEGSGSTTDAEKKGVEDPDKIVLTVGGPTPLSEVKKIEAGGTSADDAKPLSEVKKDAVVDSSTNSTPVSEIKKDTTDSGLEGSKSEEGTGEKYVKSTGTHAEGGDFNAANPGAGKEADRLLEAKGVHHEPASTDDTEDTGDSGSPSGGKLHKLKDKIKAKLHKS